MRNILKATTVENKLPLLAVENGCIVSKDADITVCYEVTLPDTSRTGLSVKGMSRNCTRTA